MHSKAAAPSSQRTSARKNLIILAGLLALVQIANGVISLFALDYSNQNHLSDLQAVGQFSQAIELARTAEVHLKKQVQEWKNILLRGSNPQDLASHREAFEREEKQTSEALVSLSQLEQKLKIPKTEQLRQTHKALSDRYRTALQQYRPNDPASALIIDQAVRGIDRAPTDQVEEIVRRIESAASELLRDVEAKTLERYQNWRRLSIGSITGGVIIVLVFLGVSISSLPKE